MVGNPNSQIEIILDGDKYTQVTNAGSKTFTIGEEYEQGPGEVGGKAKVYFNVKISRHMVLISYFMKKKDHAY